jgi:PII-like signaling protein
MKSLEILMVRVYLTESENSLRPLMKYLHDQSKVRGVTVLRGISGFGKSGKMHTLSLLDLSLDLPLIVEFFDTPAKIQGMMPQLEKLIPPGHMTYWPALVNDE